MEVSEYSTVDGVVGGDPGANRSETRKAYVRVLEAMPSGGLSLVGTGHPGDSI